MDRIELGVPDGKQEAAGRPGALLCLCCVWPSTVGISCGPGGMKRAGLEFTFFFVFFTTQSVVAVQYSLIRSGGGASLEESQPTHAAQHDAAQRNATQGHGKAAAAASPLQDEGNWHKERNGKTNGMAPGQQAYVPLGIKLLCAMAVPWAQAQLTGPSHCCSTTRSPRYTAYTQRHVVVTIRCLTELSDHTYTHPQAGPNHCHYHCRLPTREGP